MNDISKATDAELDGDLQMELVELAAHGPGGHGCAFQITLLIREIARREAMAILANRPEPSA